MIATKIIYRALPLITTGTFLLGFAALAQETIPEARVLTINERTVKRGAMIGSAQGEVVIAVPPMALEQATGMNMTFEALDMETVPDGWKPQEGWTVNLAWTSLTADEPQDGDESFTTKTKQPTVASKKKPTMHLLWPVDDFEFTPFIARWDGARLKWIRLPTDIRWQQEEGITPLTTAGVYTLFYDSKRHLTGRATWYPDRLSKDSRLAAASNEYPLRTRLKVTNIQTKESVIVTVQSVGPFVNGRIIDLTKTAFSKIGYPRKQGVLMVRVEPVTK